MFGNGLNSPDNVSGGAQILKEFQLKATPSEKLTKETGLKIANYVCSGMNAVSGYYWMRNNRFRLNRNWANGRIDVYSMFADRLQLNGKQNYVNINWKSIMITNRIISGLVGTWMQRKEKIQVTAIDPLSVEAKRDNYEEAEFVLYNKQQLAQLEAESGVPMTSQGQFIPEDKDDLETWSIIGNKLPEEIKFEMGANDVLDSEGWFEVMKEKLLHDSAETGLIGSYVWMDEYGVVHIEWVKPENSLYSYSEYPDFRDTAWRGFVKSMKVSELRRKYSREFGGPLTEQQIFAIAQSSKDYQQSDKLTWVDTWANTFMRPYDEWNINVVLFWLKSADKDGYVVTVTKGNKSTLLKRSGQPVKLDDNQEYQEDDHWNIYKGVYAKDANVMLEWGLDKNMIRPQDPKESGNVEFPISFYMYQNADMRNIAIPEKIEEPVSEMIHCRLKIQVLVAKMVPAGAAINVDALQELDLGLAELVNPSQAEKIWAQTGRLYYRGRDAEGNIIPVPIQEISNSGFVTQLQALISLYTFHYQVLKDELGEDPNLIAAATKPRVTSENVQTSLAEADAATAYCYRAYQYLMAETGKKVACLLNASVKYGAKVYRQIAQEEVRGRNFSTKIKFLPDEIQIAKFEAFLNQALAGNPQLIMYLDPFKLMRVAQEDVKLAELLMRNAQKKMIAGEMQKAQQLSEQNAQVQAMAAKQKAEGDMALLEQTQQMEALKITEQSKAKKEEIFLNGYMELLKAGVPITSDVMQVIRQIIPSITIPLEQQTQQMVQIIIQDQAEQQEPEMEEQQEMQMQPQ